MPKRALQFLPGEFYHIYNRGNEARPIFWEPENYRYFLEKLVKYLPCSAVDLVSFCLMPNHFHLLLHLGNSFDISNAIKNICCSYANALNKRYGRIGHLFQGRFRSKHVGDLEYALQVSLYIHRNPLLAGLIAASDDWEYSSCRAFLSEDDDGLSATAKKAGITLNKGILLEAVGGPEKYRELLEGEKQVFSLYTK